MIYDLRTALQSTRAISVKNPYVTYQLQLMNQRERTSNAILGNYSSAFLVLAGRADLVLDQASRPRLQDNEMYETLCRLYSR